MDEKTVSLITNYLDKVAEKLGVGIGHVWPWFIRQQYVEAYYPLALFLLFAVAFYFCVTFTQKHWAPEEGYSIDDNDHEQIWFILNTVLGLLCFAALLCFLVQLGDIFNPEYSALMKIVSMAK